MSTPGATTLGAVIIEGLFSSMPPAGSLGRIYFATDTKQHYYDNGTAWVNVTSVPANFVGDSGSGGAAGAVPAPAAGDAAAGKFLSAAGGWAVPPGGGLAATKVSLTPSTAGNFQVAHGLSAAPTAVIIQMTSDGQIWLQNPSGFDATYIYAEASEGGITATAVCFH